VDLGLEQLGRSSLDVAMCFIGTLIPSLTVHRWCSEQQRAAAGTARQRWREVASPVGTLRALLPPPVSAGWEPRMDRIPDVGEDTRAILAALGRDDGEIRRLILDGIVSKPASAEG